MTQDPNATAMQRYHDRFDSTRYNEIGELLASNLRLERDDDRVVTGMATMQDTALELCGHTDFGGAWHRLAVFCGRNTVSKYIIDRMTSYLRGFTNGEDDRLSDFEATTLAMVHAYFGNEDVQTATAHANGVHGWRGRMAYDLLAAADLFVQAATLQLAHDDEAYVREKLHAALRRVTGALYEGIRHSDQSALYNFRSTYFPTESDR